MTQAEASAYTVGVAEYMHGVEGRERPLLPGYDSGILAIFIAALLLVCINGRHARTVFNRLGRELWSVRRRQNAFDDNTVSDTGATLSLVLLTCVCEGALLFSWFFRDLTLFHPTIEVDRSVFLLMPVSVAVALAYYFCQFMAYDVVGFTFVDKIGRRQWLRGFNASQSLLALALFIPAMAALFYPSVVGPMCGFAIAMYVLARIVFIIKGFRIFYTDFSSVLVFILYLCTLEIAPIFLLVRLCAKYS